MPNLDLLSEDERLRYQRHINLPQVGEDGQARLKAAHVLIVGIGGLGSPIALYLAAAGVGHLGIADSDTVDVSNLQRQVLHRSDRLGAAKTACAAETLGALNPLVAITPIPERVTNANADALLAPYDIIIDGSDNFPTRYVLNDACVRLGKPFIFGSIFRFDGQVSVFDARRGPCYRCLYPDHLAPEDVPDLAAAGVLGVVPGITGVLQATEAIKLIVGLGDPLIGRLLCFDALSVRFREMRVEKDADCPVCG